jgi:5,10-methylenetetrahydromethanopterin reductase
MKLGVTVRPTQSIVDAADTARLIEDLGYQSAWIADHYFHREAAAALALMMTGTDRLVLGTAVMSPLLRHPTLLASLAATLREIGPDRFVLGLGVGGYEFAGEMQIPAPRPLRIAEEATAIVRELTAGRARFRGESFSADGSQLRWPAADGPVYLAGRGPKMLQLAGRIADGVITHGISPAHIAFVHERVDAGAAQAGPDRVGRTTSVALMLDVEVDADEQRAWAGLRPRCLTMAAGAYSDELIGIYGLDPDDVSRARAVLRSGDRTAAAELVTDQMARAFGLAGSAGRIADGIAQLADLGVDEVIISVGGTDADAYRTQLTDLAKELVS